MIGTSKQSCEALPPPCWAIPWLLLIALALLYVLSATFAINFNRLLGMLVYGDAKGTQMYYALAGQWGSAPLAFGISALQALTPLISKAVIAAANSSYFGNVSGFLLAWVGFVSGIGMVYIFSWSLRRMISRWLNWPPLWPAIPRPARAAVLLLLGLACLLPAGRLPFVIYLAGWVAMPFRLYLLTAAFSGCLAYLLLVLAH